MWSPKLLRYVRNQFAGAGVDNWTKPPAQNPDDFEQLTNIMPVAANVLLRRWGYQLWNSSNPLEAEAMFGYRNNSADLRYIIATAADGTGTGSNTNNVRVYDENGGFIATLFAPSKGAQTPWAVNSRDYVYFADGSLADLKKWDGTNFTNWGITAPSSTSQAVVPFAQSTITTGWQAATMYTTMGLLVDSNNNVQQLVSVNATGSNTSQYGSTGFGQPAWNNAAGGTTSDGTVTWTSVGQIALWAPNTNFAGVAAIYDPGSNAIFTANASGGTSGSTKPAFRNVPVNGNGDVWTIRDGSITWACSGTPVLWKANTQYPAWWEHPNAFCCEPILPTEANLSLGTQPIYFQLANVSGAYPNFTGANATTGTSATNYAIPWATVAGNNTTDNQLFWICLGPKGWQANFAYNQWQPSAIQDSAIVDSNGNWQVCVASKGNSGGAAPTWATAFGAQTTDGQLTWACCGSAANSTWAQATKWYYPAGGFVSPLSTTAFSESVIVDANTNRQYVIASGKSGSSAPAWAAGSGETTTDNTITWKNGGAYVAQTGNVTLTLGGRVYYTVFRNDTSGEMSDLSSPSAITGDANDDIITLNNVPVSPDSQVSSVYILATADGGDETTLYYVGQVLNGIKTFQDNISENDLLEQNIYQETDNQGNLIGVANNAPPINGLYPIYHRGRLYMLYGSTLLFSKALADLVTSTGTVCGRFESCWPPENQLDLSVTIGEGRGLASDGQVLYIGTERQIARLLGDGPSNYVPPEIIFNEAGILNQAVWRTVFAQDQPVGMMWLTPDYRVIASDYNTYEDAGSPIQNTLNTINTAAAQNAWAMFVSSGSYDLYLLAIPTGSNTVPDTICAFNLRTNKWVVWTSADQVSAGVFNIDVNGKPRWIFSAASADFYEFLSTVTQDRGSVTITSTVRTSWLSPYDLTTRKLLNELQVLTGDTGMTVTLEGANTDADFNSPNVLRSNVALVSNVFGDLIVPLLSASGKYRWYRLTFTSASTVPDVLTGFNFELVPFNRL